MPTVCVGLQRTRARRHIGDERRGDASVVNEIFRDIHCALEAFSDRCDHTRTEADARYRYLHQTQSQSQFVTVGQDSAHDRQRHRSSEHGGADGRAYVRAQAAASARAHTHTPTRGTAAQSTSAAVVCALNSGVSTITSQPRSADKYAPRDTKRGRKRTRPPAMPAAKAF